MEPLSLAIKHQELPFFFIFSQGNKMAGRNGASSSKTKENSSSSCAHCLMKSHEADFCPFIYSACKRPTCNGIRKLKTSNTSANPRRKFLICQYAKCRGFEWLDDAISNMQRTGEAPEQHCIEGCFECGVVGHWKSECPWVDLPCTQYSCGGRRMLRISGIEETDGEKYLKCYQCGHFQWLRDAITDAEYYDKLLDNMNAKLSKKCVLDDN